MKRSRLFAFGWASLFLLPRFVGAQEVAAAAKKIFSEQQDAVVWLSAVAKISYNAEGAKDSPVNIPDRESKVESLGTIIDPNGMVVTALSNVDPARDISGREYRTSGGTVKIEATANLKEVKIIMPDGTEIPAELVMRDVDLDLAFIKPKPGSKEAKGVTFKALDLKNSTPAEVTDDAITLSRADEVLNRAASVTRGQIISVTKKPREFLRATGASMGCPTFATDGKIIGITVNRSVRGRSSHAVLIPATDVLEIADQARQAKPAPEKDPKSKKTPPPAGDSEEK
jgi:S1-C subfamily serine protease